MAVRYAGTSLRPPCAVGRFRKVHPLPAPNWYPDPEMPSRLRYWDGSEWTGHYAPLPPLPEEGSLTDHDPWQPPVVTGFTDPDAWRSRPPSAPLVAERSPVRRSLRAGEVLIGLGAFALVAAGFAFLRSVWSDLGISGQIAVLLAVVFAQAAASLVAVPRIRVLGEALAGSAAVTLLLAATWGYGRLSLPDHYFALLAYGCAFAHAAVFAAPAARRARVWAATSSLFVVVGTYSLYAAPSPHLWALAAALAALLVSRVAFAVPAERFAALHAVAALVYALAADLADPQGPFVGFAPSALAAVVVLAASYVWKTSFAPGAEIALSPRQDVPERLQRLGLLVWVAAVAAMFVLFLSAIVASPMSFFERLAVWAAVSATAFAAFRFPPPEIVRYRHVLASALTAAAFVQLGWDAVVVPSAEFVRDEILVPAREFVGDVLVALGAGYVLLLAGAVILAVAFWRSRPPTAFVGAATAAFGWQVVRSTRFPEVPDWVPDPESFSLPAAALFLAAWAVSHRAGTRSSQPALPAVSLLLVPSAFTVLAAGGSGIRFAVVVAACVAGILAGFRLRFRALVTVPGAVLLVLFTVRALGFLGNSWVTLALAALFLLVVGSFFETMRDRVRAARAFLAGLR